MKSKSIPILLFCFSLAACASTPPQPTPAPPPVLSPFGDGEYWVLVAPLNYRIWNTEGYITIPKGFVTDLASVPPIFWSVLPKTGKYMSAAILHDYLYADQRCTKEQADLILKMEMETFGVSPIKSALIYKAVDSFGASAWKTNTEAKASGMVRVIPELDLDKYLSEELDESKSWRKVRSDVEASSLHMATGMHYMSVPENEDISSVCANAVSVYAGDK